MYGKTKPVFHSAQPNQTIMGFLFNLPRAASVMKAPTGVTVTASNHNNHTFFCVRGNGSAKRGQRSCLYSWYVRNGLDVDLLF
jgi:hypothetical protein